MASEIRTNSITSRTGLSTISLTSTGPIFAGIATFTGSIGIAGTLTYEDVTNIDSVGIITARAAVSIADSIVHTGDTNTSLRFPAADTITAETGGLERLRIDSSGRFLIAKGAASTTTSQIQIGNPTSGYTWDVGDTPQILIAGLNNESPTSGTLNIALRVADENTNTMFQIHNRGGGNTDVGEVYMAGKVGIGTDIPQTILHILDNVPTIRFTDKNSTGTPDCEVGGAGGNVDISADINGEKSDSVIRFNVDGEQKVAVDSNGALLLSTAGTRRNTKGSSQYQAFLVEGTTNNTTRMSMIRSSNDDNGPEIQIIKTRGTSVGSVTKPNQNDYLGAFVFLAGDDSDLFTRGAEIGVQATGTPANDRCPSDIIFSTTPTSGASTPQERLRIDSSGNVTKPTQPRALVKIYSTTTMSSGKVTNWASPTYNVGSLWDTTNKRFVAPTNGLYLIGGNFRIGAPGKVRVTRFEIRAYNTSNGHMATYGGGVGGGNNYDGGSSGYDHPYVGFTNAIYLQTGQYLELWLGEVGTEHTTYIQQHNEQSHMWCVLLQ